jgi:hypothetical protein
MTFYFKQYKSKRVEVRPKRAGSMLGGIGIIWGNELVERV